MMPTEQALREALAALLEQDPADVDPTALLSDLGVDSLIGLRLIRKIHDLTGRQIELEWLYDYPTIQHLAAFLDAPAGSA